MNIRMVSRVLILVTLIIILSLIYNVSNVFAVNSDEDKLIAITQEIIATSNVDLITHDEAGNRIIRNKETNLGNLCADAYRIVTGADIAYVNGAGIRGDIKKGNITTNDILNVFPFNDIICVAKLKGQDIKDFLEMCLISYPNEDTCFPHVSGIKFSINTSIPSNVVVDENENFIGVDGQYRVYDIKILNSENSKYEPIDLDKEYTFAASDYFLIENESGMTMLKDCEIIKNDGMLDVEVLTSYITNNLNGIIGLEYETTKNHITYTDGEENNDILDGNSYTIIIAVVILLVCILVIRILKNKKKDNIV